MEKGKLSATSRVPQRTLGLVSGDVQQVEEEWLLVANTSEATSYPGMLMTSQEWDNSPITDSLDDLSWFSFGASPRDSFEQTDHRPLVSSTTDSAANTVANDEQETLTKLQLNEFLEPPMSDFPMEQMYKQPRYYSAALSEDDMQALSHGKKNHNLKNWSAEDMVKYHESRKNLIPRVMPKVDKMNALADIEHDKQYSQRAVTKSTDREHSEATSSPRSSSSLPNDIPLSPMKSPLSSPFAHDGDSPQHSPLHTRAASSGDYFSHRPGYKAATSHRRRISPLASSSGPPSDSSTRVRSPLAQEVQFRLNPDVTFDAFLVPHKSGKGETLPDAANAKKPRSQPKLSKMPSMPLLRKRGQLE